MSWEYNCESHIISLSPVVFQIYMEILLYTLAKDRLTDGIIPIFRELGTLKFLIRQLDCIYAKIALVLK